MSFSSSLPVILLGCLCLGHFAGTRVEADSPDALAAPMAFGTPGKFKMLYDARQRPQAVYVADQVFIVYNGDGEPTSNLKGTARPMIIRYDPQTRTFSQPAKMGLRHSDHHFSPIIWADRQNHLHVLFGCHRTPGTHLISKHPAGPDPADIEWTQGPQIAPKLSYPTVFRISAGRDLVYYRTEGHTSSWTYRVSSDDGRTWSGPEQDITDLDAGGRLDWSSYQTQLPGKQKNTLHVVYIDYDDNKHSPDPKRFFNPRYNAEVSNEWKYNLSYLEIDLESQQVRSSAGKLLDTPIDIDASERDCQIWDTQWRGAGVPPAICLDRHGSPAFLHVLSDKDIKTHRYYFVNRVDGRWKKTPICDSNHQWNSGHLRLDSEGVLHAFVIVGEGYLNGGYMDRHGGGRIEEWVSADDGGTWTRTRTVSPHREDLAGWRFNNVQPVVRPDGSQVDNMLLFYGWSDENVPSATAFLLHES